MELWRCDCGYFNAVGSLVCWVCGRYKANCVRETQAQLATASAEIESMQHELAEKDKENAVLKEKIEIEKKCYRNDTGWLSDKLAAITAERDEARAVCTELAEDTETMLSRGNLKIEYNDGDIYEVMSVYVNGVRYVREEPK